ncbi:MAG TPA: outer membrane beta-barrel protein [Rubricoccaceae bacterium]|nr:outer membrane beta-barrel protein [Rubricoccaceae bacterium]
MRLLLAALLLALAPSAQAQLLPRFGITGGLNFGSISDAAALSSSTGFHVGAYTELGAGALSVRPSLLYVRVGDVDASGFGGGDEESLNFIAVPVDLKMRMGTPFVKPYVLAGPEARFVQGSITELNTSSFTWAANVGLGAEVSALIGPNAFAEVRYGLGLSGIFDEEDAEGENPRVNLFQVRVGVGL